MGRASEFSAAATLNAIKMSAVKVIPSVCYFIGEKIDLFCSPPTKTDCRKTLCLSRWRRRISGRSGKSSKMSLLSLVEESI